MACKKMRFVSRQLQASIPHLSFLHVHSGTLCCCLACLHPGQYPPVTVCSIGLQMMTHMPWRRAYASLQMLFNSELCSCLLLLTAWPSTS